MRVWDYHYNLPFGNTPGNTLDERAEAVLEIADRVGIDRLCVVLPVGTERWSDEAIHAVLEKYSDRLFGFLHSRGSNDLQVRLDNLDRWVGDGPMIGVALGSGGGICSKPEFDPLFQRIEELKAVVFQHTWIKLGGDPPRPGGGNLPRESRPEDVVIVAERHPDMPIICEHTGGDWQLGVRAIQETENVYAGISGGYSERGFVEMAVRELGADRVLYGSDGPGRSFSAQLSKVHGASISDAEKELILSENLQQLMAPILEEKGIVIDDA